MCMYIYAVLVNATRIKCFDWSIEMLYDMYVIMRIYLSLHLIDIHVCSHVTPITKQLATT